MINKWLAMHRRQVASWLWAATLALSLAGTIVRAGDQRQGEAAPILLNIVRAAGVETNDRALIQAGYRHDDRLIRWAALSILGERRAEEAKGMFVELLKPKHPRLLREAAAVGLAKLKDARGREALEALLDSAKEDRDAIYLAARLAEVGSLSGYSRVVAALKDKELPEVVRVDAASSLFHFIPLEAGQWEGRPSPRSLLLAATKDESPAVRKVALTQISIVVPQFLLPARAEKFVRNLMDDEDSGIRVQARSLLDVWRVETSPD